MQKTPASLHFLSHGSGTNLALRQLGGNHYSTDRRTRVVINSKAIARFAYALLRELFWVAGVGIAQAKVSHMGYFSLPYGERLSAGLRKKQP